MVRLRGYADCSFACHGNGNSHYGIGFDLVDEATHNEDNPFINSTNTGLFYVKSFMAPTSTFLVVKGRLVQLWS